MQIFYLKCLPNLQTVGKLLPKFTVRTSVLFRCSVSEGVAAAAGEFYIIMHSLKNEKVETLIVAENVFKRRNICLWSNGGDANAF